MTISMRCAILSAFCVMAMTATGLTQSSDVTFQVPLNLTRLSSDLAKVAVYCEVTSAALPASAGQLSGGGRVSKQVELVPSNAQLVQTVSVVVPIPTLDTSKGTSANYRCTLSGFSQSMQQWGRFGDLQTVATVFRLTPAPADITGMFNW